MTKNDKDEVRQLLEDVLKGPQHRNKVFAWLVEFQKPEGRRITLQYVEGC